MGDANNETVPGYLLTCRAAQSYLENHECGVTVGNATTTLPACTNGEGNSSSINSSPSGNAASNSSSAGGSVLTLNFLTETSGK